MDYQQIFLDTKDRLGYITINRPEVRNALNKETLDEILDALHVFQADDTISCIVFTGQGEKSFAAGADIAQLQDKTMHDALKADGMQEAYTTIENCAKPTIAMINGFALGGGCELAMACDIRIASTNAKIGLPELNLSIIPSAGGTQRLARIVGKGKAMEMILTGKVVDGEEAYRIGLVSEVVAADMLQEKTEEIATQIAAKGPLAVKLAKLSIQHGSETELNTALMIEKLSQAVLFSSEDKNEGTKAFLEKRKPQFTGK
ncbi:enoyl-CoA hydratase/isomerase family protein [Salsuginibacillus kocurii]|uniref:enoyl-CoA hydratase/isomerase family protein n=1 Tax=Salsuginibacillus kocurii TaxID=427078 RepID=UPI00037AED2E|nr:enoyl-CoA hydratase-related protein [Salsuginibacillus kocurii]